MHYIRHVEPCCVFGMSAATAVAVGGLALNAGEAIAGGGGSKGGGMLGSAPNTSSNAPSMMQPEQLQDSKAAPVTPDNYNPIAQMQMWTQNIMKAASTTQEPQDAS